MKKKHRKILEAIFEEPMRTNIAWKDIEALFKAVGAEISEAQGFELLCRVSGLCFIDRIHKRKLIKAQ